MCSEGNSLYEKISLISYINVFILFQKKLGLWIDLTNTSRFYDKDEIESYGARYLKLKCRGHGETPSLKQTQ